MAVNSLFAIGSTSVRIIIIVIIYRVHDVDTGFVIKKKKWNSSYKIGPHDSN